MSTTLFLLAALGLAPGQADQLKLTHVRLTYGPSGPVRADNKVLPGDRVCVCFDIDGMKADQGSVKYSIGMEVSDARGNVVFKQAPRDQETKRPAGTKGIPAAAQSQVGLDQPSGEYSIKVHITDRTSGTTADLSRKFTVLPRAFGLVGLGFSSDADGRVPMPVFQRGKLGWVNFTVVGFERSRATVQPNIIVTMQITDEQDKPLSTRPFGGITDRDVPERSAEIPLQFELMLKKTGKYKASLQATDKVSGAKSSLSFPIEAVQGRRPMRGN